MALLEYLACRPGVVISRQQLEQDLWQGTVVGYDALGNAINKLRKAFGDDARNPKIIETIPKTGYRLIAEVKFEDTATTPVETVIDGGPIAVSRRVGVASVVIVVLMLATAAAILWLLRAPDVEPASLSRMAFPLPEKPSIAVLPFVNLSNDPEQQYFADGMTEDLITDLSKISGLFVIARTSVFNYRNKPIEIRRVAEELGVRFVMDGSVRRVGNQVRINAQLIDATTGVHVWADRYDGTLDDILSMQDRIIKSIVSSLSVNLVGAEQVNQAEAESTSIEAYDAFLRGWQRYRLGSPEDLGKATFYFEQAIELDPEYARAHSALAAVHWNVAAKGWWNKSLGLYTGQIFEISRVSLARAMQQPTALAHQVASERAAFFQRKPDNALLEAEAALELNANDPAGHLAMANALLKAGMAAEAVESVRSAMRLDPHYPASYLTRLGQAQYALGQYENAASTLEAASQQNPDDNWNFVYLTATYGQLGRELKAQQAMDRANELRAQEGWGVLTLHNTRRRNYYEGLNYFQWTGDYKPLREGLRKAGVKHEREWRSLSSSAEVTGATTIDAKTAMILHERGVPFIDVFITWLKGRIPGSYFLEEYTDEFNDARLAEIVDKNQEVVIYSSRSSHDQYVIRATARAVSWGFKKVYFFPAGLGKWKAAGYPVETEN